MNYRKPPDRTGVFVLDYTEEGRAAARQERTFRRKPGPCPSGCGSHVADVNDPRPHAPHYAKREELPPGMENDLGVLVDCVGNVITRGRP